MNNKPAIDEQLEKQIGEYLQQHTDYLIRHPDLLLKLELQHDSGAAVSFIEHKIKLLQKKSATYHKQLENLIDVARENEELHHQLHRLTLTLLKARSEDDVRDILVEELVNRFKADAVALKLFTAAELESKSEASASAIFGDFLQADSPTCGELSGEELRRLFADQLGEAGSAALIPIRTSHFSGVLAIGSKDTQRFAAGKGVEFLTSLGELVSLTLQAVGSE